MGAARVLVVDDEARVREMIEFRLRLLGYEVLHASNGYEGLEAASREEPNLVLLDVMMPDLDGFQVCSQLKQNKATKDIPVVMLTARGDAKDVARAINSGAADYIVKPYDPVVLQQKVVKNISEAGVGDA